MRLRLIAHALIAIALTVLTQVGGLIYLAALALRRRIPLPTRPRIALVVAFLGLYSAAWFPIQAAAALNGRVGLPCVGDGPLRVATPLYCIAHRHDVRRELLDLARDMAQAVDERYPGAVTQTLDANFPFVDGFAMLPHLSHDDGRKLDLAFYYADAAGEYRPGALRSPIGYWAFEQPSPRERQPCRGRAGPLRWDQGWFQPFTRNNLALDQPRTRAALNWLARDGRARRVFIEPHLADRLGVGLPFVRFQGCNAARHDDHFHIELP
jgi:hypothetical protein